MTKFVLIAVFAIIFLLTISAQRAETYAVPDTQTDALKEESFDMENSREEQTRPYVNLRESFSKKSASKGERLGQQLQELITSIKHFSHESKQDGMDSSVEKNIPVVKDFFPRTRRSLTVEIKQELLSLCKLVERLRHLQTSRDGEVSALLHAYYEKIEYILELLSSSPKGESSGLGQVLNTLIKRRFLHDGGKRPAFHSWGGKRSGFHSWGGKRSETPVSSMDKRSVFHSWGGKRSGFHSWGGKRGDTKSGNDFPAIVIGREEDRPGLINLINRRSAFHSWGGKRDSFHSWGGKRGGFHSWGGKRDGFHSWGGKRDGFHSWGGKRIEAGGLNNINVNEEGLHGVLIDEAQLVDYNTETTTSSHQPINRAMVWRLKPIFITDYSKTTETKSQGSDNDGTLSEIVNEVDNNSGLDNDVYWEPSSTSGKRDGFHALAGK